VRESQARRVQELTVKPVAPSCAVFGVPGYRMPNRCEVNPDLVRAARFEAGVSQGVARQGLDHLEVGARLA
jgi:hypothetical protein